MPKSAKTSGSEKEPNSSAASAIPDISAPALLSFVKQVSVEPHWDAKRLADVLNIKHSDVSQMAATLEMLGYAEQVSETKGLWRNTPAGNTVSSAKPPRLNRDSVLDALEQLRVRVEQINANPESRFRVTELVAYGDFLDEHPKVQAADVGVGLELRSERRSASDSSIEKKSEEQVLSDLRAKSTLVHLHRMEDWMRRRSHRDVLGGSGSRVAS